MSSEMQFANFKQRWQLDSDSGTICQMFRIQFSNVTVNDHTESGFLWPICLQYCNCCDVNNFPDSSLKGGNIIENRNLVVLTLWCN